MKDKIIDNLACGEDVIKEVESVINIVASDLFLDRIGAKPYKKRFGMRYKI